MNAKTQTCYEIKKAEKLIGQLEIPSSKSTSIRAILAGSMTEGISTVKNVADNYNANAMKDNCIALGADIQNTDSKTYTIDGVDKDRMNDDITLNPQNSGIVLRLLMGAAARLSNVKFVTDYQNSLGVRSNMDMIMALKKLGVSIDYHGDDGRLPIRLNGSKIHGGDIVISGKKSSQFLSGILFLGSLIDQDLYIHVTDELKSKPMVKTSLNILRQGGVHIETDSDLMNYFIPGNQMLKAAEYHVGSDPASASALLAVASIAESDVTFLDYKEEEMGDGLVLNYLRRLGVGVRLSGNTLNIQGGGELTAQDFDGSQAPDAVLPLAALCCFAKGTSRFYNIEHIRYKECDRISDFRKELIRAGADVDETQDSLIVNGRPEGLKGGVEIDSHYDHGVIMALTALGLRCDKSLIIKDAQYVGQTYPRFYQDIKSINCNAIQLQ